MRRHALDQGLHPSWPNCSPRLADSIVYFSYGRKGGGGGSSMSRIQTDIWISNILNWVHVWTPRWPVHVGCTQSYVQTPRRPYQHLIPQDLDVPMPVLGSIHHDQLTPPPMVDCTPYHDWWATISGLDAGINQPLPLCTRTRPSLWYRENRDSSLKMQCLHCLRSHTLCLTPTHGGVASKGSLGHLGGCRDQYPVTRSRL